MYRVLYAICNVYHYLLGCYVHYSQHMLYTTHYVLYNMHTIYATGI